MKVPGGTFYLTSTVMLLTVLQGCVARDRNFYYINGHGRTQIRLYDAEARKWVALTGKTAKFWISQDDWAITYRNGYPIVSPERVTEARTAKDARPASEDPEGHWGAPCEGFQMGLRLEKASFKVGEKIAATLVMRNVSHISDREIYFWSESSGGLEHDIESVLRDSEERLLPRKDKLRNPKTFQERLQNIIQNPKYLVVNPGLQRKETIELSRLFDLGPGIYTMAVTRSFLTAKPEGTNRVTSGTASFVIREFDRR